MSLKYKLGDVVVLDENVDTHKGFTPGVAVRIGELCSVGTDREHYTIYTLGSKGRVWWVYEDEINHEATEDLQKSNETGDIVGKTEAVSDDNAKEVQTPALEESAPQTAPQSAVEGSFASVYNSVSVFHKSNANECLKITIDGESLVFQQECDGDIQEIRLDLNAVSVVFSAANELIMQYKEKK